MASFRVRHFRVGSNLSLALAAAIILESNSGVVDAGGGQVPDRGLLSIRTQPSGAAVYLDGQFAGQTPMRSGRLAAGAHRVRLVRDGYLENSRVVRVNSGRSTELDVTLTRQVASPNAVAAGQVVLLPGQPAVEPSSTSRFSARTYVVGVASGIAGGAAAWYLLFNNRRPMPGAIDVSPTTTGMAAATVYTFRARGASDRDGDSLGFTWAFGDGTFGSGDTVTHTYNTAGNYEAHLTVSDGPSSSSPPDVSVPVAPNMAGTWSGGIEPQFSSPFTITLTQTGGTLAGTATFGGTINQTVNLTGSVSPLTYPAAVSFATVAFTVAPNAGTFTVSFTTAPGATNASGIFMFGSITTVGTVVTPPQSSTTTLFR